MMQALDIYETMTRGKPRKMRDESRFVMFAPHGQRVFESQVMTRNEMNSVINHYEDKHLMDGWMSKTRRGEYYHGDGIVILCVSGRRRITPGMKAEQLMARCLEGVR